MAMGTRGSMPMVQQLKCQGISVKRRKSSTATEGAELLTEKKCLASLPTTGNRLSQRSRKVQPGRRDQALATASIDARRKSVAARLPHTEGPESWDKRQGGPLLLDVRHLVQIFAVPELEHQQLPQPKIVIASAGGSPTNTNVISSDGRSRPCVCEKKIGAPLAETGSRTITATNMRAKSITSRP